MALFSQNGPALRLSDVDELIRETAMDDSGGQKIMEYLRRKRGGGARMRLYDGSDNPIHFRLDHLQPVPAPQTSSQTNGDRNLALAPSPVADALVDAESAALLQPLAALSVDQRVASFVSPNRQSAISPVRNPPRPTIVTTPTGKSTLHVSPFVSHQPPASLQKQLLLQQCKRRNELKCEALRQATHLVSSTPVAGEQSDRRGPNLLNIRETISPVLEEQVPSTPTTHSSSARNVQRSGGGSVAPTIRTPVPATQDLPDGATERENDRENTPPRELNSPVIIPETPSPVRRSPRKPCTPLSGLSMGHRTCVSVLSMVNVLPPPADSQHSSSKSFSKGILKNVVENVVGSPRHRVSFSENLETVREISPRSVASLTSDESDAEQDNPRTITRSSIEHRRPQLYRSRLSFDFDRVSVSPPRSFLNRKAQPADSPSRASSNNQHQPLVGVEENVRDDAENAHNSRKMFRQGRSNAFDEGECNGAQSPTSSYASGARQPTRESHVKEPATRTDRQGSASPTKTRGNRTNRNTINMIMEDWEEIAPTPMEVDLENDASGGIFVAETQRTTTETMQITTDDTPRTVVMEILDPPSAFCDGDGSDGDESSRQTDEEAENVPDSPNEQASPEASETDSSRKRKQNDSVRGMANATEHGAIPSPKQTRLSGHASTPSQVVQHTERLVSVDSPYDHIPPDMIQAVDMIHSKVNSELLDPVDGARRTTLTMPAKRRTTKLMDADTATYFKTIENTCSQEEKTGKRRKERRKLFVPKPIEDGQNDEEDQPTPSPEPLPLTQDLVESESRKPVQQKKMPTRQLAVLVKRLSDGTIAKCLQSVADSETVATTEEAPAIVTAPSTPPPPPAAESPVKRPVLEKQNEELNEKGDQSKDGRGKYSNDEERNTPSSPQMERRKSPRKERKDKPPEQKKKKQKKPKDVESAHEPAPSSGTVQKYLKDVSNEIRQQIDSEGPRRSHRSRRLAEEILRNNPDMSRTDAPMYVMPTITDVLKYYQQTERISKKEKAKQKSSASKTTEKKKKATKANENKESVKVSGSSDKKGRGRPKKVIGPREERFDADGFRIPRVPSEEMPGPSKPHRKKANREEQTAELFSTPTSNAQGQGNSIDSGVSSAVMTNDDATVASETNDPSEASTSSKPSTSADNRSSPVPSSTSNGMSSSSSAGENMLAEKRKALDWMMLLMENRQNRAAGLPSVEIQGFTHLSLEHLTFQARKGIEYSFYVYSSRDNFGFLRVLPNVTKKTTFTKQCSLKFLILNGALKFIINNHEVNVVGGDFLMIPPNTTYSMVNGTDTTLMFMIKTTVMESHEEAGC